MKEFPYRQGVNILVKDADNNNYLLVQKTNFDDNQWGFPGGGSEEGDTPEETVKRELEEELGSTEFTILYKSPIKIKFDWPKKDQEVGFQKHNKWFRGQEKSWFIVKLTGNKQDLILQKEEIKNLKWVSYDEFADHLIFDGQWKNLKSVIDEYQSSTTN